MNIFAFVLFVQKLIVICSLLKIFPDLNTSKVGLYGRQLKGLSSGKNQSTVEEVTSRGHQSLDSPIILKQNCLRRCKFAYLRHSYLRCISKRGILCMLVSSTLPYTSFTPQKLKRGPIYIFNHRCKSNRNSRRLKHNVDVAQYVPENKLKRQTILKRSLLDSRMVKNYSVIQYISANAQLMPMQTTLTPGIGNATTRDYPISSWVIPSSKTHSLTATIATSIALFTCGICVLCLCICKRCGEDTVEAVEEFREDIQMVRMNSPPSD